MVPTTSVDSITIHIRVDIREIRLLAVYKSAGSILQFADNIFNINVLSILIIFSGDLNAKHTFGIVTR